MKPATSLDESRIALSSGSPAMLAACSDALRKIPVRERDVHTIGVTSSRRGEGRSTVAACLALADVRRLGRRCVLLDLDTDGWKRGPASGGVPKRLPSSVRKLIDWANADFGVLRLGDQVDGGELTRAQVGSVLAELLDHAVDVVADLSALPPVGSGDQFAGLLDVVVLVVQAGSTSEDVARRASLSLAEPPVVLLNRTRSAVPRWLRGRGR